MHFDELSLRISLYENGYFTAILWIGLVLAGPAFARAGWTAPVNGTVSAVMTPHGDVMMKIELPAAEFQAIDRDMRHSHDSCIIKTTEDGAANSMVLICGPAGSTVQ